MSSRATGAMRIVGSLGVAVASMLATTVAACADGLPARVDVRADAITFFPYATQTLLAADGHVRVRAGLRTIEADAVRYDLLKNKITAAGDVRVTGCPEPLAGTAYVVDLLTDRAFLIRVAPLPATYALQHDEMRGAVEGAAPAGTFEQIDLDGQRPYIRSRHAIVSPSAGVRLLPAEFPTGAGPSLTLPTYLYTLVQNQYIAQTAGPGASFDQPYNLFASTNSLAAAHVRYDGGNGVTFALDERLVDRDRAFAVVSFSPLRERRFDALSYEQLRQGLQQTLSASHTFGAYATDVLQYRLQNTSRRSTQTFVAGQLNASNFAELDVATLSHDVGHYATYQLHAGYGYDHNPYGYPVSNDFRTSVGGYVMPPSVDVLGGIFSARYDYNVTAYDYPHQNATGALTLSGGRSFGRALSFYASASFAQNANRYRDAATAARALGLPEPGQPYYAPDGTPFPGYFAFAGSSTYRTYSLQANIQGRAGDDRVQLTLAHTRDFPQSHGFGRPPLSAFVDVTRRLTPTIRVEIGRSYAFGWGGRYFSPQWTFGISP